PAGGAAAHVAHLEVRIEQGGDPRAAQPQLEVHLLGVHEVPLVEPSGLAHLRQGQQQHRPGDPVHRHHPGAPLGGEVVADGAVQPEAPSSPTFRQPTTAGIQGRACASRSAQKPGGICRSEYSTRACSIAGPPAESAAATGAASASSPVFTAAPKPPLAGRRTSSTPAGSSSAGTGTGLASSTSTTRAGRCAAGTS